jgi:CRISPR-associated endonuclease/helicase Cas3
LRECTNPDKKYEVEGTSGMRDEQTGEESGTLNAHTPNDDGVWQPLDAHLRAVGESADAYARRFGCANLGRCVGLLHDVGKASTEFQDYLARCHAAKQRGDRPPVSRLDHKLAGVRQARSLSEDGGILAIPILGHHGGMPDADAVEASFAEARTRCDLQRVIDRALPLLGRFPPIPEIPDHALTDNLALDFLIRMLFSCVVDADFLDTERHLARDRAQVRSHYSSLTELWVRFEENQTHMQQAADETDVNRLRGEIYDACVSAADNPQGVFRLTVPTGGGKTRSGMAFALKHAIKYGLQRIIVAIPYTSIIDQNAKEYREIFGQASVLEHHSAVNVPDKKDYSEEHLRMDLAAENWDAPIVVTTTVQLFESLLSNKPSKCRKLHNIARSVIILDEVQAIPLRLLQPIMDLLKELVTQYGVTLVLSTATQPALSGQSPHLSGFAEWREIVPNPGRYFKRLERVTYAVQTRPWTWKRVAEEMHRRPRVLCVVNSRRDARALFGRLGDSDSLHLSALMCPAHRRDVLDKIRARLSGPLPCRVVSTQVVEAGVDLDFPCVMRAMGPLDRIVQAAGRCNREGKMLPSLGEAIVFTPAEGRAPRGNYRMEMEVAKTSIAESDGNLADPSVVERYFAEVYQTARKEGLDAKDVNKSRSAGNFEQVAKDGRLIEEDTVPVVVRYPRKQAEIDAILEQMVKAARVTRNLWRRLQQYAVNVYRWEYVRYARDRLVKEVVTGVGVWEGKYDDNTGLSEAFLDPSDLIVDQKKKGG